MRDHAGGGAAAGLASVGLIVVGIATERMTIPVAVLLFGFLLFVAYPTVEQITSVSSKARGSVILKGRRVRTQGWVAADGGASAFGLANRSFTRWLRGSGRSGGVLFSGQHRVAPRFWDVRARSQSTSPIGHTTTNAAPTRPPFAPRRSASLAIKTPTYSQTGTATPMAMNVNQSGTPPDSHFSNEGEAGARFVDVEEGSALWSVHRSRIVSETWRGEHGEVVRGCADAEAAEVGEAANVARGCDDLRTTERQHSAVPLPWGLGGR